MAIAICVGCESSIEPMPFPASNQIQFAEFTPSANCPLNITLSHLEGKKLASLIAVLENSPKGLREFDESSERLLGEVSFKLHNGGVFKVSIVDAGQQKLEFVCEGNIYQRSGDYTNHDVFSGTPTAFSPDEGLAVCKLFGS